MFHKLTAAAAALAAVGLGGLSTPAAAVSAHDTIAASGSSWAANAVNQWVADVKSSGLRVNFTSTGSAQGRKDFAAAVSDFAISDIGYQGNDPKSGEADTSGRPYAYLPIVGGGTSFPYKILVGGRPVTNLRLSGLTLAKIFTGAITNWNDAAITSDNNGRRLPSKLIIPVVHSEGAGSTAQFTRYLAKTFPSIWAPFNHNSSFTEYYPTAGSITAVDGSDGVMNFINSKSGDGTIGYDEYSYPLGLGLPVAKIRNAAGYYVLPDQFNDAVALTQAQINMDPTSKDYLLQTLDHVYTYTDPRTYPISSYSYAVIPTAANDQRMTTPKRQTMADFLFYAVCGGQSAIGQTGYSSLPLNLVKASFQQVAKLKTADPKVDITSQNPSNCSNPTFDKAHPALNRLAEIAPQPAACDKQGAGPCGSGGSNGAGSASSGGGSSSGGGGSSSGSGGSSGSGSSSGGSGSAGGSSAGGTGKVATAGGQKSGAAPITKVNPDTGQIETVAGGSGTGTGGTDVAANPMDLAAASRAGDNTPFAILAVALLLVALIAPPLLTRRLSKAKAGR